LVFFNLILNCLTHDLAQFLSALSKVPDLERLVSRIHSKNCKLKDFLITLDGLELLSDIMKTLKADSQEFQSSLLKTLVAKEFPYDLVHDQLTKIKNGFDVKRAKETGEFMVNQGIETDYDEICGQIAKYEESFASYLREQKREWGCSELKYKDLGKEIYQVVKDLPVNLYIEFHCFEINIVVFLLV
jgi:DNA mismatch repair protein MSH6